MSLSSLNPQVAYSNRLLVAYWKTNVVEILDIGNKSTVCSPPLPFLVRSVLLYNFGTDKSSKGSDYHAYLLAGLGDGSVVTMMFKEGQLKDLKTISLGHAPVHLTPCVVEGRKSVFAAGNRSTVFYVDKGRLVNSPIMLKVGITLCPWSLSVHEIIQEVAAVSGLNTEAFPSSLMLAMPSCLFVGRIGDLNKMHIRTVCHGDRFFEDFLLTRVRGSLWT